jgi:hypothetical protein
MDGLKAVPFNAVWPATSLHESTALPFVIPSSQLACGKLREK